MWGMYAVGRTYAGGPQGGRREPAAPCVTPSLRFSLGIAGGYRLARDTRMPERWVARLRIGIATQQVTSRSFRDPVNSVREAEPPSKWEDGPMGSRPPLEVPAGHGNQPLEYRWSDIGTRHALESVQNRI